MLIRRLVCGAVLTTMAQGALAATSDKCPGEDGYFYTNYRTTNNPRAGGFVAWTATVADSTAILIQPSAAVCGNAIITGSAKISGNSIVRGDAQVGGSAVVTGNVIVEGTAKITGASVITGAGVLQAGTVHDAERTLNNPTAGSQATRASAEELAGKLQAYITTNARRFTPADGSNYDGTVYLEQSIAFYSGPCRISVSKKRAPHHYTQTSSSFWGTSKTSFDLGKADAILQHFYSPSLSTANIEMAGFTSKATREYTHHNYTEANKAYWANHDNRKTGNTVESIEAPSTAHAANIVKLLSDLMAACKQRR